MPTVEFTVKVPIKVKRKADVFVSCCPVLDLYSQGTTEAEARHNIAETIRLFLISCFERGTLEAVLKECGFVPSHKKEQAPKDHGYITVPVPFHVAGGCAAACHA